MRWALALAMAALVAVVMLVRPAPACADSWALPETSITTSCAKHARLIITPRDLSGQIDYWEDKAKERAAPGQRAGGTNHATARLERLVGRNWRPVWQTRLTNEVAPVEALVRDDCSFVVTFDNWHTGGYGPDVVAIYGRGGRLVRALALTDIVPASYVETLQHSVSSIFWRGTPYFSAGGDQIILPVMRPGAFGENAASVDFAIALADGHVSPVDERAWQSALAESQVVRKRMHADEAAALAAFRAPLLGPRVNEERAWNDYLWEAVWRRDGNDASAYRTVLRAPDAADYRISEQWVAKALLEAEDDIWDRVAIAALSPTQLVVVLKRVSPRLRPRALSHATVYIALTDQFWPQAAAALRHTGARLVQLDPTKPIPQRPERLADRLARQRSPA